MRRDHPTQVRRFVIAVGKGPWFRVRVVGTSMLPTLAPGQGVVVARFARWEVGSIVAVADPRAPERLLIKRVRTLRGTGVDVRGDNEAASTDSRSFGLVPPTSIAGRVVYRYGPGGAPGRVR